MRKLIIIFAFAVILCGGCAPKSLITLKIPDTDTQIMMKLIPAGTFNMGSPDWEVDRSGNEGPQHLVTITEPFYMGVYEVTQEQWEVVMGTNPSYNRQHDGNQGNPVETVSWDDCQDFINELNTKGIGTFRLPTEAEWEYACRAGSLTRFSWGDDPGYSEIGDYAWYSDNYYLDQPVLSMSTHFVGQRDSNNWGLYDMSGNVWEWCNDWYDLYSEESQIDPIGPTIGSERVMRGGGYSTIPRGCRSANRIAQFPTVMNSAIGFRLVMTAP